MMVKKNPTVYTVAELAGVSIATVSRALAGSPKVAAETRQRVFQAVEELQFTPDPAARRLARQRTETIALIFHDISGPYYSAVMRGVERASGHNQYNVLIYGTHGKESSGRFLRALTSKVDGLIILARSTEESYPAWLYTQGVPFVLLSQPDPQVPCDTVSVDNYGGAYQAARHLLETGYRDIAILSGPENSPDNLKRLQGYEKALHEARLSVPSEWVVNGNFQFEGGRLAMDNLLKGERLPTAVLAANDEMALGAIAAARQAGRRVPEDLAVVGFDDIQVASITHPTLTTVYQPMEQLGETAVDLLFIRLADSQAPWCHEMLPTRLVVRQSCGCTGSKRNE